MSTQRNLGVVRNYDDLLRIMRERAVELGLTRENIDEIAGLAGGHAGKLLAPRPIRRMGSKTMEVLLPALAMQLVAVEDLEWLERVKRRGYDRDAIRAKHAIAVTITRSRREMARIGRLGAMATNALRKFRKERAAKGAAARWVAKAIPPGSRNGPA